MSQTATATAPRARLGDAFGSGMVMAALVAPLVWDAVGEFIYLVRLTVWPAVATLYSVVNALSLAILGAAALRGVLRWSIGPQVQLRWGTLIAMLLGIGMLAEAVVVGGLHGATFNRPYKAHLYYWATMSLSFVVALATPFNRSAIHRLEALVARFSWLILFGTWSGYAVLETYRRAAGGLYIGYPAEQLLLPMAYFGRQRKWWLVAASAAAVLLTGKRGPMLAAAAMILYLMSPKNAFRALAVLLLLGILLPLVPRAIVKVQERQLVSEESSLGRTLRKWSTTFDSATTDLDLATSGRSIEIREALALVKTPADVLFGRGFGWYFFWPEDPDPYPYTHLAYLNYFVTYGLLGAGLLFGGLAILMGMIWRASQAPHAPPFLKLAFVFLLGFFVLSFTVNMLSVYVVFWVILGISAQLVLRPATAEAA